MNNNIVINFLDLKEINKFIDSKAYDVINYLLLKVLLSQPELLPDQDSQNIQMTKEFLQQWIVQALNVKPVGAGNYPIDVYDPEKRIGIDVKFVSVTVDKNNNFINNISNETSLAQNFKDEGTNLDNLFKNKEYQEILDNWKVLLHRKIDKVIMDLNLEKIYYFIFIRGGEKISIAIAELAPNNIKNLNIIKSSNKSVYVDNFGDNKYSQVKIYKSKKRMELRLYPKNLYENNKLLIWDFSNTYKLKNINLRKIISDIPKFNKYVTENFSKPLLKN